MSDTGNSSASPKASLALSSVTSQLSLTNSGEGFLKKISILICSIAVKD